MSDQIPRSPYDSVNGLVYFARMVDKTRLKAAGRLPKDYFEFLGSNFDGRCLKLLGVSYEALQERVAQGGSDEEIFAWCEKTGRKLDEDDKEIWNAFMSKRGWHDEASDRVAFRLKEAGLEKHDAQVYTMFDFIEVDEGRTPPDLSKWQPPRFAR